MSFSAIRTWYIFVLQKHTSLKQKRNIGSGRLRTQPIHSILSGKGPMPPKYRRTTLTSTLFWMKDPVNSLWKNIEGGRLSGRVSWLKEQGNITITVGNILWS